MYTVLLPVDTDEERALEQARYVTSLPAAAEEIEALVLFVFDEDDPDLPDELASFKSATRIGSVRRVTEHLEDAGVDVSVVEESGEVVDDVLREAERNDVDAIVLGGRKRSAVGKAIFGSVTQSVILQTDRDVVVAGTEPKD